MRRKRHEPIPQEGLDVPCGPPPEEYLYRYPVCGDELLVKGKRSQGASIEGTASPRSVLRLTFETVVRILSYVYPRRASCNV